MLSLFACLLVSLHMISALPAPAASSSSTSTPSVKTNIKSGCVDPTPVLPINGGPTELPAPPNNLTLKYVTIGHGFQNYTCSSSSSTPVSVGALAILYDATSVAYRSTNTLHTIPPAALAVPLTSTLIVGSPLTIPAIGSFPILGSHYFQADGTPTFDLFTVREILFGEKIADVKAPSSACKGSDGNGAVDWLALADNGDSVGLKQVYRVVTAGGSAPTKCTDGEASSVISVEYAAEYWFYG